jgi:pimeloyl-ACP methyl ester carboxylesterase
LVEVLVRGNRQVIRFDHRDTGQSDTVDFEAHPYTLTDMTADAVAVLDAHRVPAAHIVGASLGGRIAQVARHLIERSRLRARDYSAALHHDAAGRTMTPGRQASLRRVAAPAQVIHGTADPLLPPTHGQALAAQLPEAHLHLIPGMGHAFFSPGLPAGIADLIVAHTAAWPAPAKLRVRQDQRLRLRA